MQMLLGKYVISSHARKQYEDRINFREKSVESAIQKDLRTMNIRNIIRKEKIVHIFTNNSKEFIFKKTSNNVYFLKTVIKRNVEDNKKTIEKRKTSS